MTPAIKLLDKLKVPYKLHQYHHDESVSSFGLEAVEKLAIEANRVFKTLVVETENKQLAVGIVPVDQQLSLKLFAKSIPCKKLTMAEPKKVQASTGYILGGVSPLAQKKRLTTVIDDSAQNFETIFISGGKRGLEIELALKDLTQILNAKVTAIANK